LRPRTNVPFELSRSCSRSLCARRSRKQCRAESPRPGIEMVHLLDPPMLNSAMSRRNSQSPSTLYSQTAVVGSGPASHPTNRSSGNGGVRGGVWRGLGDVGAATLRLAAVGAPRGADTTRGRDLVVGSMKSWSTLGRGGARGVSPIASFRHFARHLWRRHNPGSTCCPGVEHARLHKWHLGCHTKAVPTTDPRTPPWTQRATEPSVGPRAPVVMLVKVSWIAHADSFRLVSASRLRLARYLAGMVRAYS